MPLSAERRRQLRAEKRAKHLTRERCGELFTAVRKTAKYCTDCKHPGIRSETAYQKALAVIGRLVMFYRRQIDRDYKRLFHFTKAHKAAPDISEGQPAVVAYWARLAEQEKARSPTLGPTQYGDSSAPMGTHIAHNTLGLDKPIRN
jgi:hypothetical protein